MADVTELRCWPSCVDAIDWSQDGIIALASDERVELLFPNTISFDRDQDVPQWQHVPLKVPLFSTEELPIKEPAPLSTYSVGEEISSSVPLAIAWSPPGLAKHRRCALATLTANLILSIWSADGKPQEESSWNRKLIVNNALAKYFLNNATNEPSHVASDLAERMRLRTRIRAFTWAPALPSSDSTCTIGTCLSYGQYMVAVSNDDNQVAFVLINSPTSTLGVNQYWSSKVLTHCSLTPDSESIFSEPTFFEDMVKQQRQILHVSWSPWIIRGDQYQSVIVYATNKDVRGRTVTYAHNSIGLGDEVIYPDIEVRYNGLIKWSPQVETGDTLKLAIFTTLGLVCMTVSAHDASISGKVTHDLNGRWDQISGAIWDSSQYPMLRLHFSSLQSTLQNPTAVLEASFDSLITLPSPSWRDQIENNLVLFSVKNDLKGNSKAKVWGLTTSPLEDFIVAYNSVHPSDMIEYGPPADRRGTIAISTMRQYSQLRKAFPSRNASSEGVLFTLKKLAQNTVEDADQIPAFAKEMTEKLMQAYKPLLRSRGNNKSLATSSGTYNLLDLVKYFKEVAFLDPNTLQDRYTILVSQSCNTASSSNVSKALIAYRLANSLKDLPSSLSKTSFSAEILRQHRQVTALINAITGLEAMSKEPSSEHDTERHGENNLPSPVGQKATCLVAATDTCDFCSASINFTDVAWAACTNGHQFPRCGLSFLAIQSPGITKYCGLCSTPFLSAEFVAAQEEQVMQTNVSSGGGVLSQTDVAGADEVGTSGDAIIHAAEEEEQAPSSERGIESQCLQTNDGAAGHSIVEEEQKLPSVTLASILFLACDVCIYCGGKFVG
ncbi:transcription factor IIIC subunit delta N-term-domain-containing protein [Pyrenochaeta sp. MPI-SDFR-AT-0127]|nr:transcription factor IIIC subunit delta N-term-domain-containing protein [Pyrenochaeta sp. MPI-SDFR-AT-0127]